MPDNVLMFKSPSRAKRLTQAATAIRNHLAPHQFPDACALLRQICLQDEGGVLCNEDHAYRISDLGGDPRVRTGQSLKLTMID